MFFRLLGAGLLWTAPLAALAGQSVADHVSMGSAAIEAHDLRTGLAHFDAALALDSSDYAANWRAAVAESGIDADFYLYRDRSRDAALPWDIIDGGMKSAFFHAEFEKGLREEWTLPPKRAAENLKLLPMA